MNRSPGRRTSGVSVNTTPFVPGKKVAARMAPSCRPPAVRARRGKWEGSGPTKRVAPRRRDGDQDAGENSHEQVSHLHGGVTAGGEASRERAPARSPRGTQARPGVDGI